MKLTAHVIPYSSITGSGIALNNEAGVNVGTLMMRGFEPDPAGPVLPAVRYREELLAFCERLAAIINAGQPERRIHHSGRGHDYDVVADAALLQISTKLYGGEFIPSKSRVVKDGDPVTVYRNEHGTFVRFPDEMVSPRFEELPS